MGISTEKLILSCLCSNREYTTLAISHLKDEYFSDKLERELFKQIKSHVAKYNDIPNKSILLIDTQNNMEFNDIEAQEAAVLINEIVSYSEPNEFEWLKKTTEEFCISKAIYSGVMKTIGIYDGTDTSTNPNSIPEIFKDAVSISFDSHIGMDWSDDAEERWNFYTQPESKIKFDLDILNQITNGGIQKRTLNSISSGVNSGKTALLCHLAASYLQQGLNVLYVSLEVRAEEIGKRIDANLLDVPINKISDLSKNDFLNKVNEIKCKTHGKLKIKEFAPSSISSLHIKNLLNDLKLKQGFVPDIILVDYLALLLSDRLSQNTNSHFYLKAVSEELRAIGVEYDMAIWTANQLTREGQRNSDADLTDVGESIGISNTCDFMLLLYRTEELDQIGEVMMKQLKNRYGSRTSNVRFNVGVDLEKQRFFDSNDYKPEKESPVVNASTNTSDKFKSKFSGLKV